MISILWDVFNLCIVCLIAIVGLRYLPAGGLFANAKRRILFPLALAIMIVPGHPLLDLFITVAILTVLLAVYDSVPRKRRISK